MYFYSMFIIAIFSLEFLRSKQSTLSGVSANTTQPPTENVPNIPGQPNVKLCEAGNTARYTLSSFNRHTVAAVIEK